MYGFVPSAGAVLADWGADVIKVEHAVTGDPQRGLRQIGRFRVDGDPNPNVEHANRGKRSIGVDMSVPEGREVIHELARGADVFLTSFLPQARTKFGIDVDDIRAVNPKIVYARGSALGPRGAESDKGGFDMTAFWCRGAVAATITPPGTEGMISPPGPAFGDTISGTNLAGVSRPRCSSGNGRASRRWSMSRCSAAACGRWATPSPSRRISGSRWWHRCRAPMARRPIRSRACTPRRTVATCRW